MRQATPWQDGPREGLEVIMRLAGRTSYVTPSAGACTVPGHGGTLDIAHALGSVSVGNPLGSALAAACAMLANADLSGLVEACVAHMERRIPASVVGRLLGRQGRQRLRIVVVQVLDAMAGNTRRRLAADARAARMRKADYIELHRWVSSELESRAAAAAADACRFLFAAQ